MLPFRLCLSILALCLCGCHNPARQQAPHVEVGQIEAELRRELVSGRRADRALGYLLTQGYEVRVTRDEKANVERIVATQRAALRDATGKGRRWHVDLAIVEDQVQDVKIRPVTP